jgi:hypothetical protein
VLVSGEKKVNLDVLKRKGDTLPFAKQNVPFLSPFCLTACLPKFSRCFKVAVAGTSIRHQ